MARKTVRNAVLLGSWAECDDALRKIGENTRDILAAENVMNEQIASARAIATERTKPLADENAQLVAALERFALAHRGDFGAAKTKVLNFGNVSFRQSSKIKLPADKGLLRSIIERLRALGMTDCIKESEPRVDKDALRKYGADRIAEVGATLSVEETFGYEINDIRIMPTASK
ncbi:MAG: host-nuclease inhibitor Gam family protein [Aristaeellaceae bacterium]